MNWIMRDVLFGGDSEWIVSLFVCWLVGLTFFNVDNRVHKKQHNGMGDREFRADGSDPLLPACTPPGESVLFPIGLT